MTYSEKLKDSRWQRKRLEVMADAGWKCEKCGKCEEVILHVHHIRYFENRDPWEYERKYLMVLCDSCHGKAHGLEKKRKAVLKSIERMRIKACNGDAAAKQKIVEILNREIKASK